VKTRIISRTVWLLSAVSLLTDVSSEMLYPVMPVFLKSIGFSFFLIGVLEGVAEALAGLAKGYFGHLSDTAGHRMPFVRAGYALSAAAKGLLALVTAVAPVFLARLLDRLGKGVRTSARDALLTAESTAATRARVFGLHRGMDTVGAVAGPLLAWLWLDSHPGQYTAVFALAFIPGLLSVGVTGLIREKKKTGGPVAAGTPRPGPFSFFAYWRQAGTGYRSAVALLVAFALVNSSDVFLLLAVKASGFSDAQMIGVYVFYNAVYALLAYPAGGLADRIGTGAVVTIGLLAFSLAYAAIGLVSSMTAFYVIFAVYAAFAACFEPAAKAMVANRCAGGRLGQGMGLFNSVTSLSAVVAGAWTGWVWTAAGPLPALLASAGGAVAVAVLGWTGRRAFADVR